jgi:hypothetical protein
MADLIGVLSSKTGIPPALLQQGLGVLLSYLKGKLDPAIYAQLESALPGAPAIAKAYEPPKDAPGSDSGAGAGLFGTIAGLAGKLFGGQSGEAAHVMATLSQAGLSADQIQTFLPKAFELLQAHLPAEVVEQVQALLPTFATPAGPEPDLDSGPA